MGDDPGASARPPGGGINEVASPALSPGPPGDGPIPPGRSSVLRPLRIRDFRLLWAGMTISLLGDGIYLVAIAFQVLEISNSAAALSIVGVAWTLPQVGFLLVAGVVSDRIDRRMVMVAADALRAVAIAAVGLLSVADVLELWHIVVLVALYGIGDAFFMPAFSAIVPDIVPRALLTEANSLAQTVRPMALRLFGPALGGFLVHVSSPGGAFLVDALTFVISGLCIALIRHRTVRRAGEPASMMTDIKEGFAFVRAHAWLWGSLLAASIGLLCFFGPVEVLVPFLVKNNMGGNAGDFGLILSAGGVGSILASLVIGRWGLPRRQVTLMYTSWSLGTFAIAFFAVARTPWEGVLAGVAMGACFAAGQVVWGTLLHRHVPGKLLGRVSSVDWMVSMALTPVSFALVGPIVAAVGAKATIAAAGVLGGSAVLACLFIKGVRDLERTRLASGRAEPERQREPL